ncbi:hypothetical protein [Colwellia sp. MEBiC06753]
MADHQYSYLTQVAKKLHTMQRLIILFIVIAVICFLALQLSGVAKQYTAATFGCVLVILWGLVFSLFSYLFSRDLLPKSSPDDSWVTKLNYKLTRIWHYGSGLIFMLVVIVSIFLTFKLIGYGFYH